MKKHDDLLYILGYFVYMMITLIEIMYQNIYLCISSNVLFLCFFYLYYRISVYYFYDE